MSQNRERLILCTWRLRVPRTKFRSRESAGRHFVAKCREAHFFYPLPFTGEGGDLRSGEGEGASMQHASVAILSPVMPREGRASTTFSRRAHPITIRHPALDAGSISQEKTRGWPAPAFAERSALAGHDDMCKATQRAFISDHLAGRHNPHPNPLPQAGDGAHRIASLPRTEGPFARPAPAGISPRNAERRTFPFHSVGGEGRCR